MILKGWGAVLGLSFGLFNPPSATADAIRFSTSGQFRLASGTVDLDGVSDVVATDGFPIGAIPVGDIAGPMGDAPFRLQFRFDHDLPPIDVSGTAPSLGYNPDLPALDPVASTSATEDQLSLYPVPFRDLIAHPDWLHTTSFRSDDRPTMQILMSVHPEDPSAVRVVPEPSTAVILATTLAGLGWRSRRRKR